MEKRLPASDNRPAAVVLSPEAPYPLDGGGALRTASLLSYLAPRYQVDLIAFQHAGQKIAEALPQGLVRSVHLVPLREHANNFGAKAQRNLGRLLRDTPPLVDRFSGYEAEIEARLAGQKYDVALLEHFWTVTYLDLFRNFSRRTVLDLHNIESEWHASCAAASPFPQSTMHRCFGRAAKKLEQKWLPGCDLVLTTSQTDAHRVRSLAPDAPVCVYPNAIPYRDVPAGEPKFAIAFSGNMEYEPNRSGLIWFTKEVWPILRRQFPELAFHLIGKNGHALPPEVSKAPGVVCTGWVADPFVHLSASLVCVAPLRSGSGTRLKIIEAWAAERAVAATSVGAEGLDVCDGDSLVIADDADAFAASVSRLLSDHQFRQKIAKRGRELFQQKYTWNVVWETLSACLNTRFP